MDLKKNYFVDFHSPTPKNKIRIFTDLKPIDWISFNQIYTPILGLESAFLYNSIYHQKHIFDHLKISNYEMQTFLENLNLDFQKFKSLFQKLESYKLAKLSIKNNFDNSVEYLVKLFSPLSVKAALMNHEISETLKQHINQNKYAEICLLTENDDLGYDIELSSSQDASTTISTPSLIVDKQIYCEFYDYIFQKLEKEFVIPEQVLELIKIYHQDAENDTKINFKKIQEFGFNSIKHENKKYFICIENFSFLINTEINCQKHKFNPQEYDLFWQQLIYAGEKETKIKFKKLFGQIETVVFYQKLTHKHKIPIGLEKWVKDCIKNKNFNFEVLNAIISFVKSLLKKIPINYLIKMSESIYENDLLSCDDFLKHIKNVIDHDLKNKNRLNIQQKHEAPDFSIQFLNS